MQAITKKTNISMVSKLKNIDKTQKNKMFFSFLVMLVIVLIILKPNLCIKSIYSGLSVWAKCVLPSLFPFMFFTKILTNLNFISKLTKKTYRLNKLLFNAPSISGYIFLMSIISGYPVGAKIISEYHKMGIITTKQANKLGTFCSTSGPLFIIGTVGTALLGSPKIGYIIFLSHILGSILNGILFRNLYVDTSDCDINNNYHITSNKASNKNSQNDMPTIKENPSQNLLAESMKDSILSVLVVGGWIAISFMVIDLLVSLNFFEPISNLIYKIFCNLGAKKEVINSTICGILEVSKGIVEISKLSISKCTASVIASFLIGFGGLSIFMQASTFLKETKMNLKFYLFQKIVHGTLSATLTFLLCLALGV